VINLLDHHHPLPLCTMRNVSTPAAHQTTWQQQRRKGIIDIQLGKTSSRDLKHPQGVQEKLCCSNDLQPAARSSSTS